jgi:hypothetical protein
LSLNLNGGLSGTPTAEDKRTFKVCVQDRSAASKCQEVTLVVRPAQQEQQLPQREERKQGSPDCPDLSSFVKGDVYGGSVTMFIPPKLIGPWGQEAQLFCNYMRDTGQREFEGEPIFEGVSLEIIYQTTGSFEDRPGWAQELYCQGKINDRERYIDKYSMTHVTKVTYTPQTSWENDVTVELSLAADELLKDAEQYAVRCPFP